uniref:Small ribosomal subunit protein uS9c n=1 Tax=Parachlorella kessleri TaxID=3074 RepID=C7BEY5_PARKE|nr:ribosomal protein S9 [Parachlorella kessleri]ACQ90977.1 ribosomal protein S9 [Parachlorella kessleri]
MTQPTIGVIRSGGRKTANVCVKLVPSSSSQIIVNGKPASVYFQENAVYLQNILTAYELVKIESQLLKIETKYDAFIQVTGGGLSAQSQAIRLALCKAFLEIYPHLRSYFKKRGFLTRDARIKERRKYGLKKARKAPQFSKR